MSFTAGTAQDLLGKGIDVTVRSFPGGHEWRVGR